VYDGAPTAITAFLSTGPKIAGFTALLKLLAVVFSGSMMHLWQVLWVLSAVTMTVGNLAALRQENIKRMLAYSSVAHAGYLLMAILVTNYDSAFGLLYYLVVYSIATLAAFGMVSLLEHDDAEGVTMSRFDGLAGKSPVLGAMFAISMLSLAGFPPTAGFLGKFFIFNAALDAGYTLLVVIAVLNSLVSVYYYLRPIVGIYMRPADTATGEERITIPRVVVPVLVLLVIVAIGAGLFPAPLVRLSAVAVSAIL
ncbi:MAG: NADH-quinone oxidoreductase subunit N, partial [Candidatus Marinimicrobia bacterium]|nr:NADH-quinone oxidoreductase subunit N [Candidatus Neomarinimicrobiota bacterium]